MQNIKINLVSNKAVEIIVSKKPIRKTFFNQIAFRYNEEEVFELINFYANILLYIKATNENIQKS